MGGTAGLRCRWGLGKYLDHVVLGLDHLVTAQQRRLFRPTERRQGAGRKVSKIRGCLGGQQSLTRKGSTVRLTVFA
jgi:hypothetical protein